MYYDLPLKISDILCNKSFTVNNAEMSDSTVIEIDDMFFKSKMIATKARMRFL